MGEQTGIEWCHHTCNPWRGCENVSHGGEIFRYAETLSARIYGPRLWGVDGGRETHSNDATWREPLKWNSAAEKAGERRRVFCEPMEDVFERHASAMVNSMLNAVRTRLWTLIEATPHLDWLLLTKRPGDIGAMVPERWQSGVPENVWLGASVCGDAHDAAMVKALATWVHSLKASHGFLSYEPAIGPPTFLDADGVGWVDWIIVGGESGPGARQFHAEWAEQVIRHGERNRNRVAVFVKQLGANPVGVDGVTDSKGGNMAEWPEHLRVRQLPGGER